MVFAEHSLFSVMGSNSSQSKCSAALELLKLFTVTKVMHVDLCRLFFKKKAEVNRVENKS